MDERTNGRMAFTDNCFQRYPTVRARNIVFMEFVAFFFLSAGIYKHGIRSMGMDMGIMDARLSRRRI